MGACPGKLKADGSSDPPAAACDDSCLASQTAEAVRLAFLSAGCRRQTVRPVEAALLTLLPASGPGLALLSAGCRRQIVQTAVFDRHFIRMNIRHGSGSPLNDIAVFLFVHGLAMQTE